MNQLKELSIYIHIPFCISKCYYCDFLSFTKENERIEEYINALKREIISYKSKLKNYIIKTIFIGGGTPSAIDSKYIVEVMDLIFEKYNISNEVEVTMESNPGTLSDQKIKDYLKANINRFSMGAQTFNEDLLKSIGRTHSVEDIYESVKLLRENGINNINIDLMSGLPNQKLKDVKNSLTQVIKLKIPHISSYSLILEEGTKLSNQYLNGEAELVGDNLDRKMYHETKSYLEENGYNHYEISNFSRPGYECRHNLVYWDINPYIGLGLGSHSYFEGKRFNNICNLDEYIKKSDKNPIENEILIDKKEEVVDYCLMGIRIIEGIDKNEFENRFKKDIEYYYKDVLEKHKKNGLIEEKDSKIYLTKKGLDLANLVEIDFLL